MKIKGLRETLKENPIFGWLTGSLLAGILLAFLAWSQMRPRTAFGDKEAQKIGYADADEHRRVTAWESAVHAHRRAKKFERADIDQAAELLKTVSPHARGNILQTLCMSAGGTGFEKEVTQMVIPYASSPDKNIRFAVAVDLTDLQTPEAKAAFSAMKDDADPEIRNEVRGRLGAANARP